MHIGQSYALTKGRGKVRRARVSLIAAVRQDRSMKHAIRILVAAACAFSAVAHASEPVSELDASRFERRAFFGWSDRRICEHVIEGEIFARTELLFGLSRAGGPDITEAEFRGFIDTQVTPRFPEGLTLLTGNGQFQDSAGNTIQEGSKLLILLYPFSQQRSALVDEVRGEYKSAFQQESVLRIDEHSCVSF
jgi:Protein of unknown function (DUF3574)